MLKCQRKNGDTGGETSTSSPGSSGSQLSRKSNILGGNISEIFVQNHLSIIRSTKYAFALRPLHDTPHTPVSVQETSIITPETLVRDSAQRCWSSLCPQNCLHPPNASVSSPIRQTREVATQRCSSESIYPVCRLSAPFLSRVRNTKDQFSRPTAVPHTYIHTYIQQLFLVGLALSCGCSPSSVDCVCPPPESCRSSRGVHTNAIVAVMLSLLLLILLMSVVDVLGHAVSVVGLNDAGV